MVLGNIYREGSFAVNTTSYYIDIVDYDQLSSEVSNLVKIGKKNSGEKKRRRRGGC